jgi:hypothetical protein
MLYGQQSLAVSAAEMVTINVVMLRFEEMEKKNKES